MATAIARRHRRDRALELLRLFGGHVEPGESIEASLRRELNEEIDLVATTLHPWFCHTNATRHLHVFVGPLPVPLESLNLKEGHHAHITRCDCHRRSQSQRLTGQALGGCLEIVIQRRDEIKTVIAAHNRNATTPIRAIGSATPRRAVAQPPPPGQTPALTLSPLFTPARS